MIELEKGLNLEYAKRRKKTSLKTIGQIRATKNEQLCRLSDQEIFNLYKQYSKNCYRAQWIDSKSPGRIDDFIEWYKESVML